MFIIHKFLNNITCRFNLIRIIHKMSKPNVYITRPINDETMIYLSERCQISVWPGPDPVPRDQLIKNLTNSDGLFCFLTDRIDDEILENAGKLKVIGTMSAGYDHLSLDAICKRGIRIGYTPGILTDATAELTVALLLAVSRRLFEANRAAKDGGWQAWAPFWLCGRGLSGATVGIVGMGRIGVAVAKRLAPFNVNKFIYTSRTNKNELTIGLNAFKVEFDELLNDSDFIIVCCALTSETRHLFDVNAFKSMKKTCIFVNTSRGDVVDQMALIDALQNGWIGGAGLDVMTPEPLPSDHVLYKLDNCVILPHIGSACVATRNEMAMLTAKNIVAALDGVEMPAELKLDFGGK